MNRILGYLLLFMGMAMIFFAGIGMYNTFVERRPVINVVKLDKVSANTPYGRVDIPTEGINALANVGLFAVFMMFIVSAGAKVAGTGVNMLKAERIHDGLCAIKRAELEKQESYLNKL